MSTFDAENFMTAAVETALSTSLPVIPEDEYPMTISDEEGDFEIRSFDSKGRNFVVLDFYCKIDNPQLAEQLGRKTLKVKGSLFLDVNSAGGLDTAQGKNIDLGKLRDAVGQNQSGRKWSITMLRGAGPFKGKVTHRLVNGDTYAEVKKWAKL